VRFSAKSHASSSVLFVLAALVTHGPVRIPDAGTALLLCYYGVGVSAVPALFWLKALRAQSTSRAAILVYLTPALGLVWLKLLVPSEEITLWVLLGFALIAGGFLLQLAKRPAWSRGVDQAHGPGRKAGPP
jgi:drug/metabolite transporter (DMT)-like permease